MHVTVNMDCLVYSLFALGRNLVRWMKPISCVIYSYNENSHLHRKTMRLIPFVAKFECRALNRNRNESPRPALRRSVDCAIDIDIVRFVEGEIDITWNAHIPDAHLGRTTDFWLPIVELDDIYMCVYLHIHLDTLLLLCFNITTNSGNDYTNLYTYSERQQNVHKIRNRRRHYNFTECIYI